MLAHQIKDAVSKYWLKKRMAIAFELGLCKGGRLRADVFALSMSGKVVVIETKSGVADFRSDKKWHLYKEYADQFYFAMDHATYLKVKADIPKGTGIFVVKEVSNRKGTRTLLKASVVQRAKWEPIDEEVRRNLIIRMAFRNADATKYKRKS
jgi:hypothetical protein